jgi:hypothetical protein
MSRYWLNDGNPLPDGRFCLVIDTEDGFHPLRTYGVTKEEVLEKVAITAEHGQKLIDKYRNNPTSAPTQATIGAAPTAAPPVPAKPVRTADDRMKDTVDLQNPATAPNAIKNLLQDALPGLNLDEEAKRRQIAAFADMAQAWEQSHPDFPSNPINKELLTTKATLRAGGLGKVTPAILESVFQELLRSGMLVPAEESFEAPSEEVPPSDPSVRPDGSPAPRTVRLRAATSYSRTALRAQPPVATQRPKYTRAQIDAMSAKELRKKYETEPGFADIVASYRQPRRAATA